MSFTSWPYEDIPLYVLSNHLKTLSPQAPKTVTLIHGDSATAHKQLVEDKYQRVYVDGGKTIQEFLRAGLLDDITIFTLPILIGNGIPLFCHQDQDIFLKLLSSQAYKNGGVQNHYEIVRKTGNL